MGGSYALIQLYAWGNMIVDYSQETGLSQAVTDTFSGEKPCSLCKKLEAVKKSEVPDQKQPVPLLPFPGKAVEPLFPPTVISLRDPSSVPFQHPGFAPVVISASLLRGSPPSPPPKA